MAHSEEFGLALSCPTCGYSLAKETEETMKCPSDHVFTIQDLLLGQSTQAGALFISGLALLEQQVKLVRAIALEHSITKPELFLQLEMQADKLDKIIINVRKALLEEWNGI